MPSFTGQLIQWIEVQHTSINPDTITMIVVGDNADGLLSESQGGKVN
jgi:hypothetical protein